MSAIRIMQISDTHLSPRTENFRENNRSMAAPLAASDHDFIIHTGDITLDGIRFEEDYRLCREFFDTSGKDILFIPGNHDIGDNPALSKPASVNGSAINEQRLARFKDYFGAGRWSFDRGNWRIIGLNSMLIGSGLAEETEQYRWLDALLASAGERFIAIFIHQPIFIDEPGDSEELTYWTVDPSGQKPLAALVAHPGLRLIASGHLHQQRSRRHGNIAMEWCSSIAFTTREELVPEMGGTRLVGYMEHELHDDGSVTSRVREIPDFVNNYLDDVLLEVYPKY